MPEMDIDIVREKDEPPWADLQKLREEGALIHLPDAKWRVVILAEGMSSGLPSVALRLDLPDGRAIVAETSLMLWSGVTIAGRARWPVAFAGGPLEVK